MSRSAAVHIIHTLRAHGHVAYLAGGCVRDRLLGLTPKDHDVATDAPPNVVQKLFRRSQPVGEAFGVVLVYAPTNPQQTPKPTASSRGTPPKSTPVEVATFRTEGVYSDGRHPDHVQFSDAQHDAQRRDFTINGLFESPGELQPPRLAGDQRSPLSPSSPQTQTLSDNSVILDHVGGLADLDSKTLRAIGDPDRRFAEDYLRMLRAVRFTTRLNFTLDPATAQAVRNLAKLLSQISRERIGGELQLMLTGPQFADAAELLQSLHLDGPALNEDRQTPPLDTLRKLAPDASYAAKLAAWMIDRYQFPLRQSPKQLVARWRKSLCLSNDVTHTIQNVLRQALAAQVWDNMQIAQRKRWLSASATEDTLRVLRAMGQSQDIDFEAPRLINDGIGINPTPLIDGSDLIKLGIKPGPVFKHLLDDAYDRQLEGKLLTKQQFSDELNQLGGH